MAGKSPLSREGSREGHLSSRLGGDRGVGGFGSADAEERTNGQGEEDPGERWFLQENSRAEIRILTRLEDDLNSSLLFEHGGGQRANPLWIARILLGCLARERLALGRVVEVFAKLQRREIMRSMVKLHDLGDFVEPPWRGMMEASTSGLPRDESMELDEAIGNHDEDTAGTSTSPGEANLGLG